MRTSILFSVAVLACSTVAANETPTSELYETATVRARAVDRATAAVTVLDRETIESLDVLSVAELIRHVPGIDVSSAGGRGGVSTAQIRGGDPNFTAVLVDGVPLNDITDTFGGSVNLNSLSAAQVERVEIVRGPISSVYGSSGLAGAINIITRQPTSHRSGFSVEATGGSASTGGAGASLHRSGTRRNYFVGATWDQEDDRVGDDGFTQVALRGSADFEMPGTGQLRLSGRVASWETEDYPEGSGGPRLGDGLIRDSVHDEAGVGVDWRWGQADRQHKLYATIYRHELDRESPGVVALFVPPSRERTRYDHLRVGIAPPVLERGSVTWTFGVEVDHQRGESDSLLLFPASFGGVTPASYREARTVGGALAEAVIEQGRLLVEAGARLDIPDRFDAELSPRVGLLYHVNDEATSFRASLGRAFKLPSFTALDNPPALGGNPDLRPESVVSIDAGIEHRFDSGRIGVTLFRSRFDDLITFDFGSFKNINSGDISSWGGELDLRWSPVETLMLRGSATRTELDAELRQRPEWVGSAQVVWRPHSRVSWSVDGRWVSEQLDEQQSGPGIVPGYPLFATAVRYRVTDRWEIRGRVDNVSDKEYETFLGFPGPERSFRVSLRRSSD